MENHRAYFVTVQFREDILQYSLLLGEEKNKNKKKGGGGREKRKLGLMSNNCETSISIFVGRGND